MDKKQKVENLLDVSGLMNEDRTEFSQILNQFTDEQVDMMIDLVSKDHRYAKFFLDNFREKREIMATGDKQRLEALMKKEEEFIKRLSEEESE